MQKTILIRGSGDLASGVAFRLHRAGLRIVLTELPQPLAVRRLVSFSEAVYDGIAVIEGLTARLAANALECSAILQRGEIPLLINPGIPDFSDCTERIAVLVDARMTKQPPEIPDYAKMAPLVIGLGPGFTAGEDCHAVVETQRGHSLGRVLWQGAAQMDTGLPDATGEQHARRVLRAPVDGTLTAHAQIGDHLQADQLVAEVNSQPIKAPFPGVLRGLLRNGFTVSRGMKIGDIDPRDEPRFCRMISDKSLAVGGGVLEAILSRSDLRQGLWD